MEYSSSFPLRCYFTSEVAHLAGVMKRYKPSLSFLPESAVATNALTAFTLRRE